jgi:voltage-gated potassium channel Kch
MTYITPDTSKNRISIAVVATLKTAKLVTSSTAWWFIVLISCVAFGFGYYGFIQLDNTTQMRAVANSVYRTVQLFSLESGDVEFPNWQLEVGRWCACFVLFSSLLKGIFQAFDSHLTHLIIKHSTDHIIVCGTGEKGIRIIDEYALNDESVVVIDEVDNELFDLPANRNVNFLRGDATTTEVLQAGGVEHCDTIFLTHPDDSANFDVLMAANEILKRTGASVKKCYLHAENSRKISAMINELEFEKLEIKTFNFDDIIARSLASNFKADTNLLKSESGQIVIVGESTLTKILILQICRSYLKPIDACIAVTLISCEAEQIVSDFNNNYPETKHLINLKGVSSTDHSRTLKPILDSIDSLDSSMFFICNNLDTSAFFDLLNLKDNYGVQMASCALQQSDGIAIRQTFSNESELLADGFQLFGLIDEHCSLESIKGETLDKLAQIIHNRYLLNQLESGAEIGSKPALYAWSNLSEQYKEANRRQADHIYIKLRFIGIELGEQTTTTVQALKFTDVEIDILARIEHRRWGAERYLDGWKFSPVRDDVKKLHPDLVAWEELSEEIKNYDREPILQIPELMLELGIQLSRPTINGE